MIKEQELKGVKTGGCNDMREIKFRMWDDEENIMIDGDSLAFEEYLPIKDLLSRDNIMQYIGLKDRNKQEIYEGDIVKGFEWYNHKPVVVQWLDTHARFNLSFDVDSLEVIGNIYENPELLETAKQDAERESEELANNGI